jgi:hypothetical protein
MARTPENVSDDTINALFDADFDKAKHLAEAMDIVLTAPTNATRSHEVVPKITVKHRDLPIVRAQINPTIPLAKVVRALATEGLCFKHNPETRDLYITYPTEFCPHGIEVKDDETFPPVCEACVEDHGAEVQAESVGK